MKYTAVATEHDTCTLIDENRCLRLSCLLFFSKCNYRTHTITFFDNFLNDHAIAVLFIISLSPITSTHWLLFLIWCICLYHDHLSIRFYFSIFVCFYSFRIVSFTVSNSDMSGKCFNHRSFLAVSHCNFMFSNCDTAITRTQTLSLSSFLSCIWNCWTMLTLLLFCSFKILICFSPLCLQTHRTIDLFHLLN